MKIGKISTFTTQSFMREWTSFVRNNMNETGFESTTGRHYNMSGALGYKTGTLADIANQIGAYQAFKTSNGVIGNKLDFVQKSIKSIFNADKHSPGPFQTFLTALLATTSPSNINAVKMSADAFMGALNSGLNSTYDGEYIFGGTKNQEAPLKDMQKALTVIKDAYKKFLNGKDPSKATPEDVKGFLNGKVFNDFFEGKQWSNLFSNATDERVQNRISEAGESVEETSSVNAFKSAIKSVMMIEVTFDSNMSNEARKAVMETTGTYAAGEGVTSFLDEQMRLGAAQNRIKQMDDFYNIRLKVLNSADVELGGVNQDDAAVRENELQQSLEIALQISSRLYKLSLLNYL